MQAGPSPGFSSRGGRKPKRGAKNQKGGHIFKIQYWMYAATGRPGTTGSPAGNGPACRPHATCKGVLCCL